MTPELNREYPELDDPKLFEQMVSQVVGHMKPICGHVRRAQHVKATGCVAAEFRIADDVPSDLRHGIFRQPSRTFSAVVRFSNSQGTVESDGSGTARGLAIKVLDVVGTRAVVGDSDSTQDFLMIDHPVFPFPDPKAYFEAISRKDIPLIGDLVLAVHMALLEPEELKTVLAIRGKHVASPLELTYWSCSPYWLGPAAGDEGHAVKYSAYSRQAGHTVPGHPQDLPDDYLTQELARDLQSHDAIFDFNVQLQTDPVAMPVEDVSIEWNENDSKPVHVATLRIPPQKVDGSGDLASKCESMSFNPWHALAEHRPMSGINRLRKVVYLASVAKRTGD